MWTLQLFSFEFGPRSYVTCICTSTGSYSCCVHIPHHHLSVRVDGSSIETLSLCWSYLFLLLAAPFSLNVRSLKGLSRPSNRRRHGNRWKILKGLRRLRWQNTYISEGLLNWTRRAAWTQKEIWADSGNFRKMKRMMWEHFCCGHMQLQSICVGSRLWPGKGPFT